ncbi:MAG: amino acid ABC transporter permease [Alphaproteobacteria bacterium]|nr:amino acid ABC transporter permease [Alphaproteobacteria bacterium]
MAETTAHHIPKPDREPPGSYVGVRGWIMQNLLSSPLNVFMTLLGIVFLWYSVPPLLNWLIFNATISGDTRDNCIGTGGACWVFVKIRFNQFMYGFYPSEEQWRINLTFAVLFIGMLPLMFWDSKLFRGFRYKRELAVFLLFIFPFLAGFMFYGGVFGMPVVETSQWGGLFLTLIIAITGIVASLPLGVLLALGRRSNMPVIKMLCIGFIELVRAVPLITVLFMASVMIPLFLPEGVNFNKLVRALIAVALFSAAYSAETIRGGLQSIPKGQYEAAASMGLSYWKMMGLVVMPQALKAVIPGIVSGFIGLFKDTTLVLIIGLFDVLNIVRAASQDPKWFGLAVEGYAFTAILFFVFCFGMSQYSIFLEKKLHTGH